jgi:3-oxoacyl-[acyl-carrier-protein] synthase-1
MPEMAELGFRCAVYGPVQDFNPLSLDRHARQTLSPAGEYALAAALEAVADAHLPTNLLQSPHTAVIIGTVMGGLQQVSSADGSSSPVMAASAIQSTIASEVATALGAGGRAYCVSSACSTGLDSIGHAYELIAFGQQEQAICGSSDHDLWKQLGPSYENWGGMPTSYNAQPGAACRPYDQRREGVVMAAGAGILVLETLEAATARGAHVYAEAAGYGCTNDGRDMFQPSGEGSARATRQALAAAARLGVERVDYVNTHGGASLLGDPVEIAWLKEVFGSSDVPPLSSTKGQTGHAQGAAGSLEAVFTLLMLEHGFLAPTANLEEVDPDCTGVPHIREVTHAKPRAALTVNAGLGGTNVSFVFRKL